MQITGLSRLGWLAGITLFGTWCMAFVAEQAGSAKTGRVVATVDGTPIFERQVQRFVEQSLAGREAGGEQHELLAARALEWLVDRELVLGHLRRMGKRLPVKEVERAVSEFSDRLERQERTLDEYLEQQKISRGMLQRDLEWQLNWKRVLAEYVTDEKLQRYFEHHRRDFDGTQLRVAHLVLVTRQEPAARDQAIERLKQVRRDIEAGRMTFQNAVRAHSEGPSVRDNGELGWIRRDGPMSPEFSKRAFALDAGAISEPVVTEVGVHLIQCLEVRAGQKSWTDVRAPLEQAAARHLFRWMSDQQRPLAHVDHAAPADK